MDVTPAGTTVTILPQGIADVERKMADGLFAVVQEVIFRARPPVLTGRLRTSGKTVVFLRGKVVQGEGPTHLDGLDAPVVAFAYYTDPIAHLQELGTVKMPANPFLGPAALSVEPDVSDIVAPYLQGS